MFKYIQCVCIYLAYLVTYICAAIGQTQTVYNNYNKSHAQIYYYKMDGWRNCFVTDYYYFNTEKL